MIQLTEKRPADVEQWCRKYPNSRMAVHAFHAG